jgi:undecaprenyl-diphosphatase
MNIPNARLALAGASLFEASRLAAGRAPVRPGEEAIFRWANEADDRLRIPIRGIMQAGTFVTVPVTAAVLALCGRRRAAAEVAAGGTAAWILAKRAKPLGGRPRPGRILPGVRTRERIAGDLGWLSGHAAVSTTLALLLCPVVPARLGPLPALVVATTAFGRMYVGAHLPLDLVGGIGLGMVVVSVVRAVGREGHRASAG